MVPARRKNGVFRRAVVLSVVFHAALLALIALSPTLPGSSRKGLIHYIPLSLGGLPGGGGGGSSGAGAPSVPPQAEAKKPSLRDLTLPEKVKPEEPASQLRYPADKPKKDADSKPDKRSSISQPSPDAKDSTGAASGQAGGGGSGLRIGLGDAGGGSDYDSQIGLSSFPYTYYLQAVSDRISSNWFTSLVDPGVRGNFQTVVYFRILRNGQAADVGIKESSGLESLDLSAVRAVRRSVPFPPLPTDYDQDYLGIFLIFEHSK
jgi:TonB family protein